MRILAALLATSGENMMKESRKTGFTIPQCQQWNKHESSTLKTPISVIYNLQ